jgi:site-specific recombinase XerD
MVRNEGLIENFLEAKYAEEGLSENSILAYSRDLEKLYDKFDKPLLKVTQQELEKYFIYLENLGHSQSTRASQLS